MSFRDIVDRVANLAAPVLDESRAPSPELVAFFIRWVRGARQLKKESLASIAGVSLSTIERVERGETVSSDVLERIGMALGYEAGYLTAPRTPLDEATAQQQLIEAYQYLEPVPVSPIKTQLDVRKLAQCHAYLPFVPEEDECQRDAVMGLIEYIDFVSFVRNEAGTGRGWEEPSRRALYADVLAHVERLKRNGWAIIAGVMPSPRPLFPEWKLAVLSITSRTKDPGAPKRKVLLVDKRLAEQKPGPFPWEA